MFVNYVIIFVSDMQKSVEFYRDVAQLPLKFETTHWTEFATEGATLALHLADAPPVPQPESTEAAGQCRPGWQVPNLHAYHAAMLDRGVRCLQPPREVFGALVAQYVDPDGLVFSVGQTSA